MDNVQVDDYARNAEGGPIARIDTIDLVRVVNSRLKTWRDAGPCRYVAAEAALLDVGSRVPAIGLKNPGHIHTAMPQTDIGSIIVSFNERVGLIRRCGAGATTVVTRAENGRTQRN